MPASKMVFIAHPAGATRERELALAAVVTAGARTIDTVGFGLTAESWTISPPVGGAGPGQPIQDQYDHRIGRAEIFVALLSEWGQGTDHEVDEALQRRDALELRIYIRRDGKNCEPLRRKLERMQVHFHQYDNPEELACQLQLDIYDSAVALAVQRRRRENLRSFFRFGVMRNEVTRRARLVYPSATHLSARRWTKRLVPQVVYEDFKAIQKIETSVRLIGAEIKSVTMGQAEVTSWGNRIWLCLPRNGVAKTMLSQVPGRRALFQAKNGSRCIEFGGLTIKSPLERYLALQGRRDEAHWSEGLGKIAARDYGVLARYPYPGSHQHTDGYARLYHYVVAGIRGLGTWGVGWYIDRRHNKLAATVLKCEAEAMNSDPVIERLLEVTYCHHRIQFVTDVTNKGQSYFDDQCTNERIREIIDAQCPPIP